MSDFAVSKHVPCNQRHALILLVREGYLVDSTRSTSSFPSMSPEDEIGPPRHDGDITLYWRQEVSQWPRSRQKAAVSSLSSMRRLGTRSTCSRASRRSLPTRRSAICCTSMHGHRFEGGAAGERERFRKTASEGQPIGLAFYPNASFQST